MGSLFSRDRGGVGDGYTGTDSKVNKANPCEGGGSSSNHEDDGRHEDEGHDDDGGGIVNVEDYQSLKRRMQEVEDCLECSACFMVPRKLPIPSCPSGHLICGDCRGKVEDKCPTCRQKLRKRDVSSLAAALYDKVEHRCKYINCKEKALLGQILVHENKCPERIIKCPVGRYFFGEDRCGKEVKFKNFNEHCIANHQKNEMIPIRILPSPSLPSYAILSQSSGKIVFLFVRCEEFMLKMFVMIAEDPEIISQYTAITSFSVRGQVCNEKAKKLVLTTEIFPIEDNFNNIEDNFENGLQIEIKTLQKSCGPFPLLTEDRRDIDVFSGLQIKVELTKNND